MRPIRRPASAAALAALTVLLAGCTVDDDIVTAIGTTRPYVADSSLQTQKVSAGAAEATIQVAEWNVTRALLTLGTTPPLDLTFGESCTYRDTAFVLSFGEGRCASGIVVDADDEIRPASLDLTFTLDVRRAKPLELPPAGDFDGDGVSNAADNCPLIDNPDQADTRMGGFGDACGILDLVTGNVLLDNDGDRVPDVSDNCAHVVNPGQEDAGLNGIGNIPDGIGDACLEQTASVEAAGQREIRVSLGPVNLLQPLNRVSFLTVDLRDGESLSCNWDAGLCEVDPALIRFCTLSTALGFCP